MRHKQWNVRVHVSVCVRMGMHDSVYVCAHKRGAAAAFSISYLMRHKQWNVRVHVSVCVRVCVCVCVCACAWVCMFLCMCVHTSVVQQRPLAFHTS